MNRFQPIVTSLIALLLLCTSSSCTPKHPESWYPAKKEHRPYLRWWWLGSAVDEEGLTFNLEQFADKGFGGVEITPIYGVQGNEANDVEYLSDRWMELLGHTLREGKRLGLGIDLNNGTGWPFGGPTITPEHSARKYILEKYAVAPDSLFVRAIRPSDARQQEVAELVRLQAVREGERMDLTPLVVEDTLRWQPPTGAGWELYALYMGRTFQKVKRAAPGGEGLVLNHYNRLSLAYYLERFEEAFDKNDTPYPDTFFNDSFEVYGASWDEKIPKYIREEWGYDLLDYLPELAGEGDAERSARIVSDYREAVAKLVLNHFTRPWTSWVNRRGAVTRNQAHGSPGNLIDLYAAVDIPECESFGRTEFDLPALRKDTILKPNDGTPAVLKFASSAAHLMGKPLTSAEALTWLTEHFRTSFAQCKPEIDLMLASGVNHIVFHGAPYSPKGVAFPGWRFYASINMSPTAALWEDVYPLTRYITRCQSFLAAGEPDNELLLYLPQYDIWHEQQGNPFLIFDIHKMDRTIPHIKAAMDALVAAGYDADYISDRQLRTLYTKRGELISKGDSHYQALLIPASHKMPTETLEYLLRLAKKGATILFLDCYPDDVPGFGRLEERDEFRELAQTLPREATFDTTQVFAMGRGRVVTGNNFDEMVQAAGIRPEPFKRELGGVMMRRKNEVGGHNYFLSLLHNAPIDGWVTLAT
ncbi:MAG: glycosyl hydrolase family 2, partial [Alistipes sp.]|nr:glycosyl hydrolase family 2 [Alistipes sp.]